MARINQDSTLEINVQDYYALEKFLTQLQKNPKYKTPQPRNKVRAVQVTIRRPRPSRSGSPAKNPTSYDHSLHRVTQFRPEQVASNRPKPSRSGSPTGDRSGLIQVASMRPKLVLSGSSVGDPV
ncbi:unnamed protein product, partial [Brassica rapa]